MMIRAASGAGGLSPARAGSAARRRAARWPRTLRALALALALALSLPRVAGAWGPAGHQAVGAMADALLTPATQRAVAALLADDRGPAGGPSGQHTLAEIADWADEVRGSAADEPHWHYDNRPVCGGPDTPSAWCARSACASAQFAAQLAVLADPRRSRAERVVALKWVVHLAGDLHQPLHAADLAEGANRILVAPNAKRTRSGSGAPSGGSSDGDAEGKRHHGRGRRPETLHAFWDSHLVNLALHPRDGVVPAAAIAELTDRAHGLDAATVRAAPEMWAEESNRLARDFALRLPGIDCSLRPGRDRADEPEVSLPRAYVARGREIVEQRLTLAGARLAWVLNQSLDPAR